MVRNIVVQEVVLGGREEGKEENTTTSTMEVLNQAYIQVFILLDIGFGNYRYIKQTVRYTLLVL